MKPPPKPASKADAVNSFLPMKPHAYLTHAAPGRCRIKIPDKRRDTAYFEAMEPDLINVSGVKRVTVNTLTASVLIQYREHELPLPALKSHLENLSHFELGPEPKPVAVWEDASRQLTSIDSFLKESSAGQIDFRSVLFITFILLAVRQMQQGNILGSASHFLWYAAQLVMGKK